MGGHNNKTVKDFSQPHILLSKKVTVKWIIDHPPHAYHYECKPNSSLHLFYNFLSVAANDCEIANEIWHLRHEKCTIHGYMNWIHPMPVVSNIGYNREARDVKFMDYRDVICMCKTINVSCIFCIDGMQNKTHPTILRHQCRNTNGFTDPQRIYNIPILN